MRADETFLDLLEPLAHDKHPTPLAFAQLDIQIDILTQASYITDQSSTRSALFCNSHD